MELFDALFAGKIRRAYDKVTGRANLLNNMGVVYDALAKKQQALDYYSQALPQQREVGDRSGEALARYNMAMLYIYLGKLAEAEDELIRVVELDKAVGHPDLESDRAMLAKVQAMRREEKE